MEDYRKPPDVPGSPLRNRPQRGLDAFEDIARQYGLVDMMLDELPSQPVRSINEEYQAYLTSPPSLESNIIMFWEV